MIIAVEMTSAYCNSNIDNTIIINFSSYLTMMFGSIELLRVSYNCCDKQY
jgi:hypothetical protein